MCELVYIRIYAHKDTYMYSRPRIYAYTYAYIRIYIYTRKQVEANELFTKEKIEEVEADFFTIHLEALDGATGVPRSSETAHPPRTAIGP